jgi:hypothetical protein
MLVSLMNFLGFGQEKRCETKIKNEINAQEVFIIGDYNFLFNKSKCVFEYDKSKLIDFTISGNEQIFEEFQEKDDFEFKHLLYPPEIYIRSLTLDRNREAKITRNNYLDSEIGIYFGEHGLIEVEIMLKKEWIEILGFAEVYGERYPIKIVFKKVSSE